MNDMLRMIGGAMRIEADALREVGQNIANAATTGYRRQVPVTRAEFGSMLDAESAASVGQPTSVQLKTLVDLSTATLKNTAEPLNVALDGAGFFVLQSNGDVLLTRRGDFHVAPDGALMSFNGAPVLGEKGTIQIGAATPTISADGVVSVNGEAIDQLRVVNVAAGANIEPLGDGTYRVDPQSVVDGSRPAVRQNFLEASNVAPVNEMIQMMEIVRRFEAEQRFARAYDGMLDKAISELGRIG